MPLLICNGQSVKIRPDPVRKGGWYVVDGNTPKKEVLVRPTTHPYHVLKRVPGRFNLTLFPSSSSDPIEIWRSRLATQVTQQEILDSLNASPPFRTEKPVFEFEEHVLVPVRETVADSPQPWR